MARSLKIDALTRTALAVMLAVQTEQADLLANIAATCDAMGADKDAASKAREKVKGAELDGWTYVRTLARTIDEREDLSTFAPDQRAAILRELVAEAMEGKPETARKTASNYAALAGKVIGAVAAGKVQWHQVETALDPETGEPVALGHNDVRNLLKPKSHQEVEAVATHIIKMVAGVKGRANDYASATDRMTVLDVIGTAVQGILSRDPDVLAMLPTAVRDEVVAAVRRMHEARAAGGKGAKQATNARDAVREMVNAPTTGPTVETVAAAAEAARDDEAEVA